MTAAPVSVGVNTSELARLSEDLGKIPARLVPAVNDVVRNAGYEVRDKWKSNAEATAGAHARLYPYTITSEADIGLGVLGTIIGPEARGQGYLGRLLEYGSVNQPPHLDGTKAAETVAPMFVTRLSTTLAYLMAEL